MSIPLNRIIQHNVMETPWPIPDKSVHTIVTSPPYWRLRDYGEEGQLGLENTPEEFIQKMVTVFNEAMRVLRDNGTLWINIGDSYVGGGQGAHGKNMYGKNPGALKPKDLVGIPWMLAFALRSAGWYLRQDIIWNKSNPMPESINDRCSKSHEYIFLLSKRGSYYFNQKAILQPMAAASHARLQQDVNNQIGSARSHGGTKHNGNMKACRPKGDRKTFRGGGKYTSSQSFDNSTVVENNSVGNTENTTGLRNKRSVWTVAAAGFKEAHFATFPPKLIVDCIKAGCPPDGIVLDPFMGAGTTAMVAMNEGRKFIGLELKPEYIDIANKRLKKAFPLFYNPDLYAHH